jgi:hypothetical protein
VDLAFDQLSEKLQRGELALCGLLGQDLEVLADK